jgi:hypothetical protein
LNLSVLLLILLDFSLFDLSFGETFDIGFTRLLELGTYLGAQPVGTIFFPA